MCKQSNTTMIKSGILLMLVLFVSQSSCARENGFRDGIYFLSCDDCEKFTLSISKHSDIPKNITHLVIHTYEKPTKLIGGTLSSLDQLVYFRMVINNETVIFEEGFLANLPNLRNITVVMLEKLSSRRDLYQTYHHLKDLICSVLEKFILKKDLYQISLL